MTCTSLSINLLRISILALSSLLFACAPDESPRKPVVDALYTQDWQFIHSETALDLATVVARNDWTSIQLPHTPNDFSMGDDTPFQGDTWYRKVIDYNPEWRGKRVGLRFEAAMNEAHLWLNGEKIAQHLGGYLPFSVDLTEKLVEDRPNQLLIRLDNRDNPTTGPKTLKELDFANYGGLYRPVYLQIDNDLYITDAIHANKTGSGGIRVSYPEITAERALIDIQTHVANAHYDPKQFRVVQRLMDGNKVVSDLGSALLHIEGNSEQEQTLQLILPKPRLWSPQEPNLYQLVTRVYDGNSLVEEQITRIGIREFKLVDGQLSINGMKMRLRGTSRYQEYPYLGFAISAAADYRDAVHIKSAGFDAVYLSHYPQSSSFLEAADELGLVVINTIPGWDYFSEDPGFQAHAQQTCRDLIRRDRNHPSVLAWACALNVPNQEREFATTLSNIVREENPGALSVTWQPELSTSDILMIPQRKETDSDPVILAKQQNSDAETLPFIDFYTTIFNYRRGYAPHLQTSGVMTIDRQAKDAYYFFQSQRDAREKSQQFASGFLVYIANRWTPGSPLEIPIFSNADQVELLINGKSLGKQYRVKSVANSRLAHSPFYFRVEKYQPGELKAVAYHQGKIVAEHKVVTPKEASGLRLKANIAGRSPQTGIKDALFVYAQLTDATGNPVYSDGVIVNFSLEGQGKLISPPQSLTHKGIASVLIEIGGSLEELQIIGQTDGLAPANLKIK